MAGDFREAVSEALDELAAEDFKQLLRDVLSTDRLTAAVCPHCKERVSLRTPDYRGYAAALSAFDGIGKGRQRTPDETQDLDERIDAAVQRALAGLTDDELESLEHAISR